MSTGTKTKIEAIYPLSNLQQGMLLHHLTSQRDEGLLHVQCRLSGSLNIELLQESWKLISQRHESLRSSVHWKKMDNPLQIVRPEKEMIWEILNWDKLDDNQLEQELSALKNADRERGIDFEKNPLNTIRLIQVDENSHILLWLCHHLLLDGWSGSVILKDVFKVYASLFEKEDIALESVPSYKSYLSWAKKESTKKDGSAFWNMQLNGFEEPVLFDRKNERTGVFTSKPFHLDQSVSQELRALAREYKITIGSLFQGIWALILGRYFGTCDVVSGLTVSGRSKPFPKIELMSGMFANVIPNRTEILEQVVLADWFRGIQKKQMEIRDFEDSQNEEILDWIEWKSPHPLFDNLFVFENFPWNDIVSAGLTVKGFQSGLTTTYPLTLTVIDQPLFHINLQYDLGILDNDAIQWFEKNIYKCIHGLLSKTMTTPTELANHLHPSTRVQEEENTAVKEIEILSYSAPKNEIQLRLVEIWESNLNVSPIGIQDDFFQLGGKSLTALKVFSSIQKKLGIKLNPTVLLEHPTIESISQFLNSDSEKDAWEYTVPIKNGGDKVPLFCIHGGGGHVFFFKEMADQMNKARSVYALQPSGFKENHVLHTSIEQMAKDYADEIMQVYPKGPYNILVYCFSTAVGIEMANHLEEKDHEVNLIVVDSIVEQENFHSNSRIKSRVSGFVKRVYQNPLKGVRMALQNQWVRYIKPLQVSVSGSEIDRSLNLVTKNLIQVYNNYSWSSKHRANLFLILTNKSSQLVDEEYKRGWRNISEKEIKVSYTQGHHSTLFEGQDATVLASKLDDILENI